jgi:hypothetical protein
MDECDYFIYRVGLPPSLKLLPHPKPAYFEDTDVGLLPRGDQYTIAALVGTNKPSVFKLHTFHSEIGSWTSITMSLDAPPEYPRHISRHVPCLSDIYSHTVITLGGEGGTMGWVDLWRGILLCDVRSRGDINLRFVPVPLPLVQLTCNDGRVDRLGCPEPYRGIAYIKGKNCLRFVDLEFHSTRLDGKDKEIGWTIRTWSNFSMTGSRDDWKLDRQPVHARNIDKSKKMHCQLRDALQQEKSGAACLEMKLQNLCVSNPTPSMNGRNVVYLRTKAEFMNTKACVLAVDMENIKLQYVVEFGAERAPCAGVICHPVSISRLLMNQAASQGNLWTLLLTCCCCTTN